MLQVAGDGPADLRERAGVEPLIPRVNDGGCFVFEVDDAQSSAVEVL